jgi:hypothetical protein
VFLTRGDVRAFAFEKQSIATLAILALHAASCDLVNDFLHPPECMEKEDERILLLCTNLPLIWVACVQGMVVFKICAGCRSWLLDAATI